MAAATAIFGPVAWVLDQSVRPALEMLWSGLRAEMLMATWMEEMGLHAEGFSDIEIAQIDAARDDFLHIWATYQQIKPRIDRITPVVRMILDRLDANQKAGQI